VWHPETYGRDRRAFKARTGSNPLSFNTMDTLALRLAAAGGRVDDLPVSQLVAAGFTLLQRSAPLVRALAGRRAGLLLVPSPAWVVAVAASDGRGAVLLDPTRDAASLSARIGATGVGAVFTVQAAAPLLPLGLPYVCLDDVPAAATVISAERTATRIDLGSHFPLTIEGATDVPGRDEECLVGDGAVGTLTHRTLLQRARWSDPLLAGFLTPLLHGEAVRP
jgi:hypothetical protein